MAAKAISKVLVVEDEETLTWSMTKTLVKDRGKYELIITNSGKEALAVLEKNSIDVVVTDIRMPDINGLDLLSWIREKYPSTKVIIMTAYGSTEVQKEATRRGSFYYIEKPFEISDIRTLILKALEEKRGGFIGQIVDLHLVDIIQMSCLGMFTMSLTVSQGNEKGLIFFENGEITHAEVRDLEGKEALYTILEWSEGRFNSQMGVVPSKKTIMERWEHLLIEGMRRQDDAVVSELDSSTLLHEVERAFENLDQEAAVREWLERILRILTSVVGFRKGFWADSKGNMLTIDDQTFTEEELLVPLLMSTMTSRLGKNLGQSQVSRINLGYKNNQKIVMIYNHFFLMIFLLERTSADEFYASARNILERRLTKK
jgi:CheY-like chemotaxis protein